MIPITCKRLIDVDIPVREISENALDEQNVRKGHLHSLHVWWATRPLGASRAVILAGLLPDPADENCPESFRKAAAEALDSFGTGRLSDPMQLRKALLEFIATFSSWEASHDEQFLNISRKLINSVYPGSTPLVLDPFAGIGSIPFEALRVGADCFAGDLNPVSSLLLRATLEEMPRYSEKLTQAVAKWGELLGQKAKVELSKYFPSEEDGSVPLAYIWARTIRCEGPGCGAEVPLLGLMQLSEKEGHSADLKYEAHGGKVTVTVFKPKKESDVQASIANRFTATCPVCHYTTPYEGVVRQLRAKKGGTKDARMIAVISIKPDGSRSFRAANDSDFEDYARATKHFQRVEGTLSGMAPAIPSEPTPVTRGSGASRAFSLRRYGMDSWGDVYTPRQLLVLNTYAKLVRDTFSEMVQKGLDEDFAKSVSTFLGLAISGSFAPYQTALSFYSSAHMRSIFMQGMAIPMRPDFAEANPLVPDLVGGYDYAIRQVKEFLKNEGRKMKSGTVSLGSATNIPLPDRAVSLVVTDPPYYDAVPYSSLADFCYVWLKRMVGKLYPDLFQWEVTPKTDECIEDPGTPEPGEVEKDKSYFQDCIRRALVECNRVLDEEGLAVVLFAHKGTAGWEALLNGLVKAGWTVTASWPIGTERGARMRARNSAVLVSTVFLVCRPRLSNEVGDWRQVLSELQPKVHTWLQRLVQEDIVGADAIFACIGPALENYSQYASVETPDGKKVELADEYGSKGDLVRRGYLTHVWEAVAKEALGTIFLGADPAGFEEDSRLTAIWLWTLRTQRTQVSEARGIRNEQPSEAIKGYPLEYDTARKIAQGLGVHLDQLAKQDGIVSIKGNVGVLLSVSERKRSLFGEPKRERKQNDEQLTLSGGSVSESEEESGLSNMPNATTLDLLHRSMILFGEGKSEALKRLLTSDTAGKTDKFWRLANALAALYPKNSEERRWVEGVIARKKMFGL